MKYPVYVEIMDQDRVQRELVENDDQLQVLVASMNNNMKLRFAGYPSVVGNLATGQIK